MKTLKYYLTPNYVTGVLDVVEDGGNTPSSLSEKVEIICEVTDGNATVVQCMFDIDGVEFTFRMTPETFDTFTMDLSYAIRNYVTQGQLTNATVLFKCFNNEFSETATAPAPTPLALLPQSFQNITISSEDQIYSKLYNHEVRIQALEQE